LTEPAAAATWCSRNYLTEHCLANGANLAGAAAIAASLHASAWLRSGGAAVIAWDGGANRNLLLASKCGVGKFQDSRGLNVLPPRRTTGAATTATPTSSTGAKGIPAEERIK